MIGEMLQTSDAYADAEDYDREHKNTLTRTSSTDRQPRHRDDPRDDHREEWRHDDHNRRYEERAESSKVAQYHRC